MQGGLGTSVVDPYAKALMAIAQQHDLVDAIAADIASLRQMLSESAELAQFLGNPVANSNAKKGVLSAITQDGFNAYTQKFLMLLVDRGRIILLDAVCTRFQTLVRELKGIVLAEVTSAVELTDAQLDAVRDKVKAFTQANGVEIEALVDASLIGGVTIKVGSQVVDASLRGQLRRLSLSLG